METTIVKCTKEEKALINWLRKAASKDLARPTLTHLNVKNGKTEACNGFTIHTAPTPECLKEYTGKVLHFTQKTTGEVNEIEIVDENYPDTDQVYPMGDFKFRIGVNPKFLIDALSGFDGLVSLTFYGETRPFVIASTDSGNPDQKALVMPIYLDPEGYT